jgi:NAD(P)-dependent dehydrogenase (short-subunit alcohol dehydrogenase family)
VPVLFGDVDSSAREVAPAMLTRQRGVIVNVSSTYGMVGADQRLYESESPDAPREFKPVAYSVTKSGVLGFTRYLAAYWAGTGIRVNTLTLGGVLSDQPPEFVHRPFRARTSSRSEAFPCLRTRSRPAWRQDWSIA